MFHIFYFQTFIPVFYRLKKTSNKTVRSKNKTTKHKLEMANLFRGLFESMNSNITSQDDINKEQQTEIDRQNEDITGLNTLFLEQNDIIEENKGSIEDHGSELEN